MDRLIHSVGLEWKVAQAIRTKGLLASGERIVVAVSGGPDSVALFRCLVELRTRWNWDICIGHVNHGFRGAESDEDAKFVETLAARFGVPVRVCHLHLNKCEAKLKKESLQEYARTARYQALEQMALGRNATKLVLGHTADDQAETVLMWMLRGCGTGGLGGIPPKRGAYVVRPLLDIQRSEIVSYLEERQEEFRVDSTNDQPVYLRNRIRQHLVPQLKQYSPGIVSVLTRQAQMLRDDHTYLEALAVEAAQRTCVSNCTGERQFDRLALLNVPLPIRRRVVRQSLQTIAGYQQSPRFDLVERVLDRLEHGQSGWNIECNGVLVSQEYDRLVISSCEKTDQPRTDHSSVSAMPLSIPGEVVWLPTGHRFSISRKPSSVIDDHVQQSEIYLDAARFTPELTLRSWVPGDVFCPKGLGGRQKKLQDFFSDIKLPRSQRTKVPLMVAPEGIVWVGGLRADERFQVSPSTTSVILAKMIR
ncbi:MAG TPA: tRNA lysidine(34) synthetase TilS [Nitrospirales bacterium]|nr:tRNA lysidine(34) synthetase TilS [Nitrospiraceae bacterium]HNP28404.1 tRNA lysidine(34) synthetase TilS [Nitrospirales bacterium]